MSPAGWHCHVLGAAPFRVKGNLDLPNSSESDRRQADLPILPARVHCFRQKLEFIFVVSLVWSGDAETHTRAHAHTTH